MSYSQAFSDTEIVTIAAVAATALGGVVIGLGRGQARHANDRHRLPDVQKLSRDARRQIERHAPSGEDLAGKVGRGTMAALETARERVPSERPSADFKSFLPGLKVETSAPKDVAASLRDFATRLAGQLGVPEALESATGKARQKAGAAKPRTNAVTSFKPDGKLSDLISGALSMIPSQREMPARGVDASDVKARLQEEVSSVAERLSDAPEVIQAARERTQDELQTRVAQPVSRAASTTKDVTMESLAAAAWLVAGAAVVYFGLLSSERREQVKSGLCNAIEQGRLLALDLQGYEPEM